jgi:tetratricopeptide (TPR) repeat protein
VELEPHDYLYWGNLADAYRWARGWEQKAPDAYRRAVELAEKRLDVNPNAGRVKGSLATYHAKLGEKEAALREIAEALELAPGNANIVFDSLLVYAIVGEHDRALEALKQSLDNGYSFEEISREPELSELRRDPRYHEIAEGR